MGETSGNINNKNFNSYDVTVKKSKMELYSNKPTTINDQTNFYKLNKFKYLINEEVLKGNEILITSNYKLQKVIIFILKRAIIQLILLNLSVKMEK